MIRFELTESEDKIIEKWNNKHKKKCKLYQKDGAIGGRLTYEFTPTGLGSIIKVKCACGKEINLTDSSNW